MNKEKLEYFRGKLQEERQMVSAKLTEHGARPAEDESHGMLDPLEAAEEFAELVTRDALVESEGNLLEKIDLALSRIGDGSYGSCLLCGENIPTQRLEAKPSVSLCTKCQTTKEAESRF